MLRIFILMTLVAIFCPGNVWACSLSDLENIYDSKTEQKAITHECDKAIVEFSNRANLCDHFAGEEPYNETRANEIGKAETDLKCDTLLCDYKNLLQNNINQQSISKLLKSFQSQSSSLSGEDKNCKLTTS